MRCFTQSIRLMVVAAALAGPVTWAVFPQGREKFPPPERLDQGIVYRRDGATGELRLETAPTGKKPRKNTGGASSSESPTSGAPVATIRSRVNLVEVSATVRERDGEALKGLRVEDFRVFEDGAEQRPVHFDAGESAVSLALVIDASPSVLREWGQLKDAARTLLGRMKPQDEIALVVFAGEVELVLPWTSNRQRMEQAVESLEVRRTGERGSKIYESVFLTAQRLFAGRSGRKAILLLTDGQDTGLGLGWSTPTDTAVGDRLTFEDVCRALAAPGVEVHIVSTQNRPAKMTEEWLGVHRGNALVTAEARDALMPHYTVFLAELVRRVGGGLYFVRETGTLAEVYRRIAETVGTQYALGYYSSAGSTRKGWRRLRVEVLDRQDARVEHRPAYYVPNQP